MINGIFTSVATTINRHPKSIAGLLLVIFLIAVFSMTRLTMQTSADTCLDKDSARGILYNNSIGTFQSTP